MAQHHRRTAGLPYLPTPYDFEWCFPVWLTILPGAHPFHFVSAELFSQVSCLSSTTLQTSSWPKACYYSYAVQNWTCQVILLAWLMSVVCPIGCLGWWVRWIRLMTTDPHHQLTERVSLYSTSIRRRRMHCEQALALRETLVIEKRQSIDSVEGKLGSQHFDCF